MSIKAIFAAEGQRISVLGDRQQLKLTGKDSNGRQTVILQELPAGSFVPSHVHDNEDEYFHILEGVIEFEVGDEKFTLSSGDMIFLPRKIPHSIRVISPVDAKVRLDIVPSGVEEMFLELNLLSPEPPDMKNVIEICGRYGVHFV
jgi:quercetin dioxygenase-like cupin family protein